MLKLNIFTRILNTQFNNSSRRLIKTSCVCRNNNSNDDSNFVEGDILSSVKSPVQEKKKGASVVSGIFRCSVNNPVNYIILSV
jgi:hypothetical protein